jgi:hypothetical protein
MKKTITLLLFCLLLLTSFVFAQEKIILDVPTNSIPLSESVSFTDNSKMNIDSKDTITTNKLISIDSSKYDMTKLGKDAKGKIAKVKFIDCLPSDDMTQYNIFYSSVFTSDEIFVKQNGLNLGHPYCENGKVTFDVDHFSTYIIVSAYGTYDDLGYAGTYKFGQSLTFNTSYNISAYIINLSRVQGTGPNLCVLNITGWNAITNTSIAPLYGNSSLNITSGAGLKVFNVSTFVVINASTQVFSNINCRYGTTLNNAGWQGSATNVYDGGIAYRGIGAGSTWDSGTGIADFYVQINSSDAIGSSTNLTVTSNTLFGFSVLNFTVIATNITATYNYSTLSGTLNTALNSGSYNINILANSFNQTNQVTYLINQSFINVSVQNTTLLFNYSYINTSAYDVNYLNLINTSTNYLNSSTSFYSVNQQTTTGYSYFLVDQGIYSLYPDATGYAIPSITTFSTSTNVQKNVTFNLYPTNSVQIFFFNQSTSQLMSGFNYTVKFTNSTSSLVYTNITSQSINNLTVSNLTPNTYTVTVENAALTRATNVITITNRSTQILNIYLSPLSANNVVFTLSNDINLKPIEGVTATVSTVLGNTSTVINSFLSDSAGNFQFNYVTDLYYTISLSKAGYSSKQISFTPIIFTSYQVYMTQVTNGTQYTGEFADVSVVVRPSQLIANTTNAVTVTIGSPTGSLTTYNATAYGDFGTFTASGSNAVGGVLTLNVPVFNATALNKEYISYTYNVANGSSFTNTVVLSVDLSSIIGTSGTNTADNWGLSIWDRIIIMVFVTLVFTGLGRLFGGYAGSVVAAFFCITAFTYVGFLTWYLAAPMVIFLFIIILGGNKV